VFLEERERDRRHEHEREAEIERWGRARESKRRGDSDDQCAPSVYLVYTQCTPKLRKRRGNNDDDKSIKDDKSIFCEHKDDKSIFWEHLLVAKSGDGSKVSLDSLLYRLHYLPRVLLAAHRPCISGFRVYGLVLRFRV
jgi:hypothetical protein